MESARAWVPLSQLVGAKLPLEDILNAVRQFDRREALFTLGRIAADLANTRGGVLGSEARAWTHNLLVQRIGSANATEDAVSRAVARLSPGTAVAHGHVVFALQHLILTRASSSGGRRPDDGQLAFLMLALNDHLPSWPNESAELSATEGVVASMFFASVFNESSYDPLRFLVRITRILGGDVAGSPIGAEDWVKLQVQAFGCSFRDYAEQFLVPVFMLSRTWRNNEPPVLAPTAWTKGDAALLYERWFREASLDVDDVNAWPTSSAGPLGLPPTFFRTPFVRLDDSMLCLSPWHLKDHVGLGSWAKLNSAAKQMFGTDSNQRFASTFGYLFEHWCAGIAQRAKVRGAFKGKLVLPTATGADDEIEDVVVIDRDRVVLFSAKSSLVPENSLKCATSQAAVIKWLKRFYFDEGAKGENGGYRGGALRLLDRKVQKIRNGDYTKRGIKKNALVLPVVVCFDKVGETPVLYKWIDEECSRLGILSA